MALLAIKSFIFWKLAFAISSQAKTASCLSIAWRGSVWWLRCGMKFPMYVTIPMKLDSCCLSIGGVISVIPCIFFGQGCMPSALYSTPKNETLGCLSSNFFVVQYQPFYLGYIEEVDQIGIMVLIRYSIHHYVIVDAYDSWAPFHIEVHLHLEDIL